MDKSDRREALEAPDLGDVTACATVGATTSLASVVQPDTVQPASVQLASVQPASVQPASVQPVAVQTPVSPVAGQPPAALPPGVQPFAATATYAVPASVVTTTAPTAV